jgi:hypothetical protein
MHPCEFPVWEKKNIFLFSYTQTEMVCDILFYPKNAIKFADWSSVRGNRQPASPNQKSKIKNSFTTFVLQNKSYLM